MPLVLEVVSMGAWSRKLFIELHQEGKCYFPDISAEKHGTTEVMLGNVDVVQVHIATLLQLFVTISSCVGPAF